MNKIVLTVIIVLISSKYILCQVNIFNEFLYSSEYKKIQIDSKKMNYYSFFSDSTMSLFYSKSMDDSLLFKVISDRQKVEKIFNLVSELESMKSDNQFHTQGIFKKLKIGRQKKWISIKYSYNDKEISIYNKSYFSFDYPSKVIRRQKNIVSSLLNIYRNEI